MFHLVVADQLSYCLVVRYCFHLEDHLAHLVEEVLEEVYNKLDQVLLRLLMLCWSLF